MAVFLWLDCGREQTFLTLFLNQNELQWLFLGILEMAFIRNVSIDRLVIRFIINIVYS